MEYCPPNVSLSFKPVWLNHGISHCYMDTVSTSVIAGFILIFGTIQLLMYRKYARRMDEVIAKPKLYKLQIFLLAFVPALALLRFILQASVYNDANIYGYMVSNIII